MYKIQIVGLKTFKGNTIQEMYDKVLAAINATGTYKFWQFKVYKDGESKLNVETTVTHFWSLVENL